MARGLTQVLLINTQRKTYFDGQDKATKPPNQYTSSIVVWPAIRLILSSEHLKMFYLICNNLMSPVEKKVSFFRLLIQFGLPQLSASTSKIMWTECLWGLLVQREKAVFLLWWNLRRSRRPPYKLAIGEVGLNSIAGWALKWICRQSVLLKTASMSCEYTPQGACHQM